MAPEKGFAIPCPPPSRASARYTPGQLWQVPVCLLGIAVLLAVWLTRPLWYDPAKIHLRRDLIQARRWVQDPHTSLNGLTVLLNDVLNRIDRLPERAG
jgi:hypothetical protein